MEVGGVLADIIKSVTEAGPKTIEVVNKLFPGVALRSQSNAASHSVHSMLSDMEAVMRTCSQQGMSPEMQIAFANVVFEKHGCDERVAKCLSFALPSIQEDGDPFAVDDEWVDYWRVHALEHVEELRKLIEAELAYNLAYPRDSRVVRDLEDGAALLVEFL